MFEAFQLGPFLFRTHLLFVLLGTSLGAELFLRLAVRDQLPVAHFLDRAAWYLCAFLLGGRLFAVLVLYRVYLQDPLRFFILWDGTWSLLGGCIGVGILLFSETLHQRSPSDPPVPTFRAGRTFVRAGTFLQWLDALVPGVTLSLVFDWLGRFLAARSYGGLTDMPWGIVVEAMSVRYTVPIHPVQLYYAAAFLLLTIVLLRLHKRRERRAGLVTLTGIVAGAVLTVLLEFLRGDFAVTIFAKVSDFAFLGALFASLGVLATLEQRVSPRYSAFNSILMGTGTVAYLLARPWISVASIEWRFSQFLAVLAVLGTVVYVVVHRWKYPHL